MTQVLVTGANGFVGQVLGRVLVDGGHSVTGLVRHAGGCGEGVKEWVHDRRDFVGLAEAWPQGLGPDCVIHLAARVHVMHDDAADPDAAFRATNVDGTLRIAAAARQNGARRFVFVSSIKAIADADDGRPLCEDHPAHPEDPYGRSKLEAERALVQYGNETGLEVVIVRPPLVYGPQVRANFLRLMDAIWRGVPLPLGAARAKRSLVYVGNLADALMRCATDSRAAGQCFHVADGSDPTVTELAQTLGRHLQKRARLFSLPSSWLRIAGRLTRRSAQVERLIGSLQVDTTRIRRVLDWHPPYSVDDGLAATAHWYRSKHA
ncbi:MAG: SDR family oxidoreductase [Paraburkholderia sp.]|uniref:UDP-glucose 4-epimerase family protein n=1 Tax=Paraburkholderia sp. TaxID=1926495 RepID=UPI0011F92B7C|nr:SDR family oxidoreductase [Paraburkholderia sp.]TAL97271.1 MAG: SDR family oxidoreductase [Paraburkholderia sp.]